MEKKGQLKLSFGMIFSIILVILFLVFAFYAIQKFLSMQEQVQLNQFKEDFQGEINKLWQSTQGSKNLEYKLPSKTTSVCFDNGISIKLNNRYQTFLLEHVDWEKTLGTQSNLCFKPQEGRVNIVIEKNYGEALVTIKNE